ncbi:hypothetical protein BO99DRAFT_428384 [Aspergillus violaceofuscus CBS 115571]|uniref:Uncharacterized protein n=1 Tax=Aspergillus violaceofuscus (strain CBS 115571) TaxID=1450538 RepID=A0A2V5HI44_ASPV1|nr:hypothetical protein BO99DRAFT_428384 [Aspergillus violaceofuscus CBS 115571]
MARLKPPASRDDEQKHGKVLRKQTNELAKRDREINALLSHVDFLISLVNKEKTLSQARDVTRFTYATVFFLPVGLAVSIFSMSGPPDHTAIVGIESLQSSPWWSRWLSYGLSSEFQHGYILATGALTG